MSTNKLDMLMLGLSDAVARAPKRRPRRTRSGDMTPEAQAVLMRAAEHKLSEARAALSDADKASERHYYRRVARLAIIGKRYNAARKALEGVEWGSVECARLLAYAWRLGEIRSAIFALEVMPADIADGGRFYRRAVWLGLSVGMEAVDEMDVVQGAAELCLIKGQIGPNGLPTLGAMYRNMKAFYNGQLDRFRRNKARGMVAVHSMEALSENMGDAWMEANAATLQFLGFGYSDQTELDKLYPARMVDVHQLPASRAAQAANANRARAQARIRGMEAAARDTLAEGASTPEGYDAASFNADRMAIRAIINGAGLDAVAALCNVSTATLSKRLLALEGTLGATIHSTGGSDPITGSESRGVAAQPRAPRAGKPAEPRYRGEGWTAKRNGCRASEVVITKA